MLGKTGINDHPFLHLYLWPGRAILAFPRYNDFIKHGTHQTWDEKHMLAFNGHFVLFPLWKEWKNETALSFSERSSSIYPWSLKPEKSRRFLLFIILCFPIFISPFFSSVSIMFFVLFICFYVQTFALTAGRGTHLEDLFKWNSVNDITYTSCRVQFSMIICFYNFQNHNHWFAE